MRNPKTSVRSWVALLLGAIFACGTAYVLFSDVRSPADISIDHVNTGLVLLGTVAAGHYFGIALRTFKLLLAIGCAVLFVAGTFVCVVGSASRGAELNQKHTAEAHKINAQRETTERELIKARNDREQLSRDFRASVHRAKAKSARVSNPLSSTLDSHLAILQVRLDRLQPEQPPNGGLRHASEVFAFLLNAEPSKIERGLVLASPFAKALILELATIIFFGLALGHSKGTVTQLVPQSGDSASASHAKAGLTDH